MNRARPAGGDQREASEIAAPLDGVHAGGSGHVLVDHPVNRHRGIVGRQPQAIPQSRHGGSGRGDVQVHLPAQEEIWVEVPEQEVGIGDRRHGPAPTVAGRTGVRPGAFRPHRGKPEGSHAGEASSARPDLDEVDDGNPQREPAPLGEAVDARGLYLSGHHGPAVLDQAGLGGGPAHVESEDVGTARRRAPESC